MNKVFVTGADGLLGSNLVRSLLDKEYEVRVLIQPGKDPITLKNLQIEQVEADILNADALDKAVEGCDVVIHVAAITNVWPTRGDIYYKVNVDGTLNMIEAALKHKVKRFIHVGSASSFGFGTKDNPGNEESPWKSAKYGLDYIDSKLEGQKVVHKAVIERGLPAIVVNPTFMIGAYDSKPSSGEVILQAYHERIPAITSGGKNWVYVKDVAEGICNGIEMGRIGEAYILGHQNMSYKEAFNMIANVLGKKPPKISLPDFIIKIAGRAAGFAGKLFGFAPKLSYPVAWIACDGHYFSPAKAVKELNLPQTPVEQGVKEAFQWFEKNGYLD